MAPCRCFECRSGPASPSAEIAALGEERSLEVKRDQRFQVAKPVDVPSCQFTCVTPTNVLLPVMP